MSVKWLTVALGFALMFLLACSLSQHAFANAKNTNVHTTYLWYTCALFGLLNELTLGATMS